MPFNSNLKAKTSADENSGLPCFIPTIAAIFNEGTHIVEKDRMALAFKNHYRITGIFSRDTLKDIIQNTRDPIEREALLTPVLRQMMINRMRRANPATDPLKPSDTHIAQVSQANTPLASSDLLYLADDLGISLEAYDPQNNILDTLRDRKNNVLAFPAKLYAHVLKIKNDSTNWEFERAWNKDTAESKQMLDVHNAHYQSNLRRFNAEALRTRVKTEVEAGRTRLSRIFAEPEIAIKTANKATENDFFGGMLSKIKDTVGGIAAKAGDFIKGISSALPTIKEKIGGITSGIGNVVKSIFGGLNAKSGLNGDIFSGLFKMIADLFKTIMGLFGQAAPKAKAATPKPSVANGNSQARGATHSLSQAMSSAANSLSQIMSATAPSVQVPPPHLTQFERMRAEPLRFTAGNASQPALALPKNRRV